MLMEQTQATKDLEEGLVLISEYTNFGLWILQDALIRGTKYSLDILDCRPGSNLWTFSSVYFMNMF